MSSARTLHRVSLGFAGPSEREDAGGSRLCATFAVTAFFNRFPAPPERRRTGIFACTHGGKWVTSYHRSNGRKSLITRYLHGDHAGGNPLTLSPSSAAHTVSNRYPVSTPKREITH